MSTTVLLRVTFNKKYAKAPGRGIEIIYFKNITYNGTRSNISIMEGYNEERGIRNIIFENLKINGEMMWEKMDKPGYNKVADMARIYIGPHVEEVQFIKTITD